MGEFVTSLITLIDYKVVLTALGVYVVAMWLMFCLWVFFDARKRYHSVWTALLFGVLVFVFTFPALIFYLVIRPEETLVDHAAYFSEPGGVNVPIVNFMGSDGEVEMAINLQVYKQPESMADMKVRVDWDSQKPHMQVQQHSEPMSVITEEDEQPTEVARAGRFSIFATKAKGSFRRILDTSRKQVDEYAQDSDEEEKGDDGLTEATQISADGQKPERSLLGKKKSKKKHHK